MNGSSSEFETYLNLNLNSIQSNSIQFLVTCDWPHTQYRGPLRVSKTTNRKLQPSTRWTNCTHILPLLVNIAPVICKRINGMIAMKISGSIPFRCKTRSMDCLLSDSVDAVHFPF